MLRGNGVDVDPGTTPPSKEPPLTFMQRFSPYVLRMLCTVALWELVRCPPPPGACAWGRAGVHRLIRLSAYTQKHRRHMKPRKFLLDCAGGLDCRRRSVSSSLSGMTAASWRRQGTLRCVFVLCLAAWSSFGRAAYTRLS